MTAWLEEVFGTRKPVIAMVHFPPLPGTPLYDAQRGIGGILTSVRADLDALQRGGVDGLLFSNEGDRPYATRVDQASVAVMAAVIGQLRGELTPPFGVDVLWDPMATLALAKATGARFVREVFTGAYGSDLGVWDTDAAAALRYRRQIDAGDVRMFFNIKVEFAEMLAPRPLGLVARSTVFSSLADGICVSGPMAGQEAPLSHLKEVKAALPATPVVANTGVTQDSVGRVLEIVDAAIVGTAFKVGGDTWNPVDPKRVTAFMAAARSRP